MSDAPLLHLAIIPDGNRRWAKKLSLMPWKGHEKAVENFSSILKWCRESGRIGTLTVWCFSTENWKRDPKEVERLMEIYEEYLQKERAEFVKEQVRFIHTGRRDRIPKSLEALILDVEAETAHFTKYTLNLAVDYGGKDEIVRAMKKVKNVNDVTEENFRSLLDHPEVPDIDLIVRTSGEQRTSNFFLWQSAYAEWVFLPKFFPDLMTEDLNKAVKDFDQRKRRFGG